MPTYKITYLPGRGRVEVARQLLHLSGVPFEDVRVTMDEWSALKHKAPFGQIPILEVDGKPIPQSFAINRYLAREFGSAGKSAFESAWVDAVADQHRDFHDEIQPALMVFFGFNKGDKAKLVKDVVLPARDKYFPLLEKLVKDNGINGHFVGSSLTWVDLLIADHLSMIAYHVPGLLDGFPIIMDTIRKIESTPKLKEWIEKRPESAF